MVVSPLGWLLLPLPYHSRPPSHVLQLPSLPHPCSQTPELLGIQVSLQFVTVKE